MKNRSINISEESYEMLKAHCIEYGLKINKYLEILIKEKLCSKKEKQ